eukprot:TRINITY_DN16230_c6_g1_i1.p1 TRINITY_DN16230_c6_g1~~TRINITY_DN16230_c6_g1_i1.p1  ORF type:complete len:437 (+),score=158.32 TRINITY_DN16230_c6_g1_i1:217-1527(+)
MACITGDETGLLRVVSLEKASLPKTVFQVGVQDRDTEVLALVEGRARGEYFAAHRNGTVTCLRGSSAGEGIPTESYEAMGTLLPPTISSALFFDKETSELATIDDEGNLQIALVKGAGNTLELESVRAFEINSPLSVVLFFKSEKWGLSVAVGGRDREVHVYQASTGEKVWKAKELPHTNLGLRRKVFPTGACILGNGELCTVTGYLELRRYNMYDEENRRPLMDWKPDFLKEQEVRFFTALPFRQEEIICGDNTGGIYRINAVSKQLMMKYRGCSGTARQIAIHPTLPFLASAGLSRYLYVHDIESGKMVSKAYLKQRLNATFFLPGQPFLDKYTHTVDEEGNKRTEEDVNNAVWMDLAPAAEKPAKRSRAAKGEAVEPEASKSPAKKRIVRRVVKRKLGGQEEEVESAAAAAASTPTPAVQKKRRVVRTVKKRA